MIMYLSWRTLLNLIFNVFFFFTKENVSITDQSLNFVPSLISSVEFGPTVVCDYLCAIDAS